jgi:hypothetical protein
MWETVLGLFLLMLITGVVIRYWVAPVYRKTARKTEEAEDVKQADPRVWKEETWCFIHENVQGRWCMKAKADNCSPPNRFRSKEECEMIEASAMPLGLVQNQGRIARPLAAISTTSVV